MGKQIGFYMTHADEQRFIAMIKADVEVVVVSNNFKGSQPTILDPLRPVGTVLPGDYNASIFTPNIDPIIVIKRLANKKAYLDTTKSEVIQFKRCTVRLDGKLEPGRLWYDPATMQCRPKRKVFRAWAADVFQIVKSSFHFSRIHSSRYFGPDAWRRFEAGQIALAPY
jgi:hypothetical protein